MAKRVTKETKKQIADRTVASANRLQGYLFFDLWNVPRANGWQREAGLAIDKLTDATTVLGPFINSQAQHVWPGNEFDPADVRYTRTLTDEQVEAGNYELGIWVVGQDIAGTRTFWVEARQPGESPQRKQVELVEFAGHQSWIHLILPFKVVDGSELTIELGANIDESNRVYLYEPDIHAQDVDVNAALGPIRADLEALKEQVALLSAPPLTFEPAEIDYGVVSASTPVRRNAVVKCTKAAGWFVNIENAGEKDEPPPANILHRMLVSNEPAGFIDEEHHLEPDESVEITTEFEWRPGDAAPTSGQHPVTGKLHVYAHGNDANGRIVEQDLYLPYRATISA